MITIKVLGPGCSNCKKLEEVSRTAAGLAQVEAEIIKVTDMQEIIAAGVIKTPGLMINGKLLSSGRIPAPATIADWISEAA
jgi:small redox-active disulfide protein 2